MLLLYISHALFSPYFFNEHIVEFNIVQSFFLSFLFLFEMHSLVQHCWFLFPPQCFILLLINISFFFFFFFLVAFDNYISLK